MIELKIIPEPTIKIFKSYDELFLHLNRLENLKMLAPNPDFTTMSWSFTIYTKERISLLLTYMKEHSPPIQEAYDQGLPVIEICAGDFSRPKYVVKTPALDMSDLKKKWVIEYCAAHKMALRKLGD